MVARAQIVGRALWASRPRRHTPLVLCGLLLAWVLAGCGQKGPLYLPDTATTPAADTSSPAQTLNRQPER